MGLKIKGLKIILPQKKRNSSGFKKVAGIVQGVVKEDEKENFTVAIKDNNENTIEILPFTDKSFNLRGRKYVFCRKKDNKGKRICKIRDEFHAKFMPGLPEQYIPFTSNWVVKGYVVQNGLVRQFDFKSLVGVEGYPTSQIYDDL